MRFHIPEERLNATTVQVVRQPDKFFPLTWRKIGILEPFFNVSDLPKVISKQSPSLVRTYDYLIYSAYVYHRAAPLLSCVRQSLLGE